MSKIIIHIVWLTMNWEKLHKFIIVWNPFELKWFPSSNFCYLFKLSLLSIDFINLINTAYIASLATNHLNGEGFWNVIFPTSRAGVFNFINLMGQKDRKRSILNLNNDA